MNLLDALLLGAVEGLTEFLPVSSTGHMILASRLLRLPDSEFLKSFEVVIQLGAILAVEALYFARLWKVLIGLPTDPAARRFAISVAVQIDGVSVAGAVVDVSLETTYAAHRGGGATMTTADGVVSDLQANEVTELSMALLPTGFGYGAVGAAMGTVWGCRLRRTAP